MRRRRIDAKKFIRFLFILALAVALTVAVVSSLAGMAAKTLKIGLYETSRPLTYTDERKNVYGFEAEYAKLLAERLGKKPEIKLYAQEGLADALDGGAIDCAVSVRQSVHDYIANAYETAPFISYGIVFVISPDDETFAGEEDVRGKRAGLIANSEAERLCEELMSGYSFNCRYYDHEVQPFQDLKLKKNDFVIADELFARYMQVEDPKSYLVLDTVYYMADFGVRLSKKLSQSAIDDMEDAVYALRSDVAAKDLFVRYFGADLGYQ